MDRLREHLARIEGKRAAAPASSSEASPVMTSDCDSSSSDFTGNKTSEITANKGLEITGREFWAPSHPDVTWHHNPKLLVLGLGRIFRLERSALFMAEFRARLELGAINFHLKPCMFTWAKIGSPFEVTILALYSTVSSYHLTSTGFIITI